MTTIDDLRIKLKNITKKWFYLKEEVDSKIPSASSTTPSADTTSGSVGTGTTWAKADHTHPKSTLYAEASHIHNNYLTNQDITGKADSSDFDTVTATVTYTDNTSETVTFYIVPSNNNG